MCLADEESVDDLLLNCKAAHGLRSAFLIWVDCGCSGFMDHLEDRNLECF